MARLIPTGTLMLHKPRLQTRTPLELAAKMIPGAETATARNPAPSSNRVISSVDADSLSTASVPAMA